MGTAEKIERPFYEPGWYRDLSNEEYHGSFGTSSSQLKTLIEHTPAHLAYGMTQPNAPTPAMALGTAVHTLVLEPEKFDEEFIVAPKVDKRTKAGKEAWAEFEEMAGGREVITEDALEQAKDMAASVMAHPIASILLSDVIPESSIYWWYKSMDPDDDSDYKEMLKVRPDAICRAYPVVVDLKTTIDGTFSGFARAITNFHYHVSAAMYLEGVNQCKPILEELGHFAYTKFVFVCVENKAPYLTSVYELSLEDLDLGKTVYRRALRALRFGRENNWPGFPEEVRVIELPDWARRGYVV